MIKNKFILSIIGVILLLTVVVFWRGFEENSEKILINQDTTQYVFVSRGFPIGEKFYFEISQMDVEYAEESFTINDGHTLVDVRNDIWGYDSTLIKVRKYYFNPLREGSTDLVLRYPDGIDTVKIIVEIKDSVLSVKKVIQELKPKETYSVIKLEIIYLGWSVLTRATITKESIWRTSGNKIMIENGKDLFEFERLLGDLGAGSDSGIVDVRIGVKIVYTDGKTDTLSMGPINTMEYRNRYYGMDQPIAQKLVSLLPEDAQEKIYYSNLRPTITGDGFKEFLQGKWQIKYWGVVEEQRGPSFQIFKGDTLTFEYFDESGILTYRRKAIVEFYDNLKMRTIFDPDTSNFLSQTFQYFIESPDSIWTVIHYDVMYEYSRMNEGE